jgi:hypothetical protein
MRITRYKNRNYGLRMTEPEFEGLKLLVGLGATLFSESLLDGRDASARLSLEHGVANVTEALAGAGVVEAPPRRQRPIYHG